MKINSYHSAGSTYPKLKPQKTINLSDVEWIGFRFLDNISKTFKYNNKYYKAIYPNAMEYTLNLFKSGIIDGLIEKKFIPETTITNYTIDKFPLVLMQETEFFNIDSINWNPLMLKDAAKKVIDLQKFLIRHDLMLKDGHTKNIIFQENCTPKWCDIGSIVPLNDKQQFCTRDIISDYLYPLMIREHSISLARISRYLSKYHCTEREFYYITNKQLNINSDKAIDNINQIEHLINNISFKFCKNLYLNKYNESCLSKIRSKKIDLNNFRRHQNSTRIDIIKKILIGLKPQTVLDIGSNLGVLSILAAQTGAEVLAVGEDECFSCMCYENLKLYDGLKAKTVLASAEYLPGNMPDLVLAIDLTHILFFIGCYRLEIIAKLLANRTSNALLTEFKPNGMDECIPKTGSLQKNYNIDLFLTELSKFFKTVRPIPPPGQENAEESIIILAKNKRISG